MIRHVTAAEFRDMVDADRDSFTVVDTRRESDFEGWHVAGARHYRYTPGDELDPEAFEADTGIARDETVVTMCAKGKSSLALAEALDGSGYDDVVFVEGGMREWAAVYDHVTVPIDDRSGAEIVQIQRRAKGCLGYLVVGNDAAAAIDVSRHGAEWIAAANERDVRIDAVLDTHVHADHISGGRELADALDVPYYLPAAAAERDVSHAFEPLEPNEVLEVGGVDVKALATPGHTSDAASYLVDATAVCTGDALFVDGVGRTELQFGEGEAGRGARQLYASLHRTLLAEPDGVSVLPGHFSVAADGTTGAARPGHPVRTTVGEARVGHDLLELDESAFVDRVTATAPEKPPNYEAVIAINRGHEEPADESAAIDLELGPNRCAAEPGAAAER